MGLRRPLGKGQGQVGGLLSAVAVPGMPASAPARCVSAPAGPWEGGGGGAPPWVRRCEQWCCAALRCSQLIAARRRPEHVPTYEVLYKTAEEVEHKREERKKLLEAAALEVHTHVFLWEGSAGLERGRRAGRAGSGVPAPAELRRCAACG